MPGVSKRHRIREHGLAFPASRYDDPRGGRPSALERNILRYRAAEVTLYLFFAEDVRDFLLTNIYPKAVKHQQTSPGDTVAAADRKKAKKLATAMAYAVAIEMFNAEEAADIKSLLDYRNDIAHRIHLVMSDISRSYWNSDHIAYSAPTYKGDALDRLRAYRNSLWDRAGKRMILTLSMDGVLFETAERVFEEELKRLDKLIVRQIARERIHACNLNAELDLRGTELIGDLDPRFPTNHRMSQMGYGDDWSPPTGHLTARGVEICYRLFDLGKSQLAVSYLMGISLKAAKNRKRLWLEAGGSARERVNVTRYDLKTGRKLDSAT